MHPRRGILIQNLINPMVGRRMRSGAPASWDEMLAGWGPKAWACSLRMRGVISLPMPDRVR
ncbi:MAG: hypothetical protein IPJ18_12060 [Betaproteobacteria bacterium]|nr:hypothetical protein [Betaproteobacteria bacterium]